MWFEETAAGRGGVVAVPVRPRLALGAQSRRLLALGALFLLALLSRAPAAGTYLAGWDAVQYALGLVDFDVARHQPHPPGSILYVGAGRLLLALTGDAQTALGAISVLAGAAAVVLCYVAGRAVFGGRIAAAGTLLYLVSPLSWYYGAVALPYALEGALALGVVALLWRAAEERRPGAAAGAAALLAVAGGVRQTTILLLLPLWLYATWRACDLPAPDVSWCRPPSWRRLWPRLWPQGRGLILGLALLASLCLLWLVPLLALSGGPVAYFTASRRLSSLASSLTSVFAVGLPAIGWNVSYLAEVVAMGLNLALLPFAVFLVPGVAWPWCPSPAQAWFLRLWAVPALLVYVLLHVGQAGYLLLLWPLICFAAGSAALVAGDLLGRRLRRPAGAAGPLLLALIGIWSAVTFLCTPVFGPPTGGLTLSAVRENDRAWRATIDLAAGLRPDGLAVLTGTRTQESFRLAAYYLPDVPVYAVGLDRAGDLGVAFRGDRGEHTYAAFMAGAPATRALTLPPRTRRLLILDESVARLYPPHSLRTETLTATRRAWLWPAAPSAESIESLTVRSPLGDDGG